LSEGKMGRRAPLASRAALATFIAWISDPSGALGTPKYVELDDFGYGGTFSWAISADGGSVVGSSATDFSGVSHAFVWRANTGKMISLVPTNMRCSLATGVNANGTVVVGLASEPNNCSGDAVPFRWQNGSIKYLDTLGGTGRAWSVSGNGAVSVGEIEFPKGHIHAYLWTANGAPIDLGAAAPSKSSSAHTISYDGRTIIGDVDGSPVVWNVTGNSVQMLALPKPSNAGLTFPLGVNANGSLIAGQVINSQTDYRAILWALKGGQWSIIVDAAKANIPAGATLGASFVDVAGTTSHARAIGVSGGLNWSIDNPRHAFIADLQGASITWTDANFIPGMTGLPADRILDTGGSLSLDGASIAGSALVMSGKTIIARKGFLISGLSNLGGGGKKSPRIRQHYDVTCVPPCGLGPPVPPDLLSLLQPRISPKPDETAISPSRYSRLELIMERMLQRIGKPAITH
jgi:probable HAF family extracellular repeat protein